MRRVPRCLTGPVDGHALGTLFAGPARRCFLAVAQKEVKKVCAKLSEEKRGEGGGGGGRRRWVGIFWRGRERARHAGASGGAAAEVREASGTGETPLEHERRAAGRTAVMDWAKFRRG
jgi:hypothetical protein